MAGTNRTTASWNERLAWYFERVGRENPQSSSYMPFDDAGYEWKTGKRVFALGEDATLTRKKEKAALKAMTTAHELYTGHSNVYYVIGVITSGLRGYDFALDNKEKMVGLRDDGRISTKNLSRNLGGDAFNANVLYPSLVQNIVRGRIMEQNPQNRAINFYIPSLGEHTAFDDRRNLRFNPDEVTYMTLHYPEIDASKGVVHPGDWFSSRNGTLETWRGTLIQLGLHPFRPDADILMVDEFMKPMSLYDRTKPLFDVTHMITDKGFIADTHATVLLRSLYADDMLKGHVTPPKSFDENRVHQNLKWRQPQEEQAMEDLKKDASLMLYQKCRDFICMDDLPQDYLKNLVKRLHPKARIDQKNGHIKNVAALPPPPVMKAEDYDYNPDFVQKTLQEGFNPAKFYTGYKKLYEGDRTLPIDEHASHPYANPPWKLMEGNAVRRSLIRLTLGSMGITLASNTEPLASLILCDPKINRWTLDWAQSEGVKGSAKLLESMAAKKDSEPLQKAIQTAAHYTEALKLNITNKHPSRFAVSMHDISRMEATQADDPFIFSPHQASFFSSSGRMTMRDEIMTAFCDEVIFDEKWAQSPDLVYHMGRAFLTQSKLVKRPPELAENELSIQVLKPENENHFTFETTPITLENALDEIAGYIIENDHSNLPISAFHGMVFLQLKDVIEYNNDFYRNRGKKDIAGDYRSLAASITKKPVDFDDKMDKAYHIICEQSAHIFPDVSWLDGLPEHERRIYFKSQGQHAYRSHPSSKPDGALGYTPRL